VSAAQAPLKGAAGTCQPRSRVEAGVLVWLMVEPFCAVVVVVVVVLLLLLFL
jgi:hypothetical protein